MQLAPVTQVPTLSLAFQDQFLGDGSNLDLVLHGVLLLSATDSSLIAGCVGIRSIGAGTIDAFSTSDANFLPYRDYFSSSSGPNLSDFWITRAGGYTTAAPGAVDMAKGTAALNLATLGRVNEADVEVQASVNVTNSAGQFASLAARYSGGGDLNMYLATVAWDGTQFVASISKKVNGVTTVLAFESVTSGTGTLDFTVIGGQLNLSFDGIDFSVFDFSLKCGSVGLRSSLGFDLRQLRSEHGDLAMRTGPASNVVALLRRVAGKSGFSSTLGTSQLGTARLWTAPVATRKNVFTTFPEASNVSS
jgi:hypothetical protein